MSKWTVSFEVTVHLDIKDEEILSRVETPEWTDMFFFFEDPEKDAVEMLARCLGVHHEQIGDLDGWADVDDNKVSVQTEIDLLDIEKEKE